MVGIIRVGERPPHHNAAPFEFSTADFIEEGALPSLDAFRTY